MSELWDVYTIDRKKNGKICARGEQENLLKDVYKRQIYTMTNFK